MASGVTTSAVLTADGVAATCGTVDGKKTQLTYFGFSARATVAGTVNIRQGTATGPVLDTLEIPVSPSIHQWYGPQGRRVADDIFVDVVDGTVEVVVFYG